MRVTICQTRFTIGDFKNNSQKILDEIQSLMEVQSFIETQSLMETQNLDMSSMNPREPHIVLFPEGSLTGYPLHDLVELDFLMKSQNLYIKKLLSALPPQLHVFVGAIVPNPKRPGRPFLNAALYFHKKKVRIMAKTLLPTWDVFNEERWFEPGSFQKNLIKIGSKKVLVTICEDIWGWDDPQLSNIYTHNPLKKFKAPVDVILNLSASPFTEKKESQRYLVIKKTVQHFKSPLIYCNRWGAEDELIFDGHSLVCQKDGTMAFKLSGYQRDRQTFHVDKKNFITLCPSQHLSHPFKKQEQGEQAPARTQERLSARAPRQKKDFISHVRQALILGIQEYCRKNHFSRVHIGLSGGLDSAVVTCLATEALGSQQVHTLGLPTQFNTKLSFKLAKKLTETLRVSFQNISIEELYQVFKRQIDSSFSIKEFGLVHENLQARIRALFLMAYANHSQSLLLATSNKSELATGYGTLYGDMSGGLFPIGDLYKTQVIELARWYQKNKGWMEEELITRAPSAELRPNQKDQDSLPEYSELDPLLSRLLEKGQSHSHSLSPFILKKVLNNEFKRWQAAPVLKVSCRSFGRGRHWPLSHSIDRSHSYPV
jgi:NAD+ synthase (glutamine-hydrolysing)